MYASFGTRLSGRHEYFRIVAESCADLGVQLVISTGGAAVDKGPLPGSPLVVSYAPQPEVLTLSELAITHAGLNSVLEALNAAVPMVAVPVTNDQPAVASRVRQAGVGEVVPVKQLSVERLRYAIRKVLANESYRQRARQLQREISEAGGVRRAADLAEYVLHTGKPAAV